MFKLVFVLFLVACSNSHSGPSYKFLKAPKEGVAAKVGDVEITNEELMKGLETEVYEQEMEMFNLKFRKIKELLVEKFVAKDSKSKGMTKDDYLDKYVFSKVKVTDKEVDDFVKKQKVPETHLNDQFKAQIKSYIARGKKRDALEAWIAKQSTGDIQVFVEKPIRPTFDVKVGQAPSWGSKTAKVTIVEFSDFQCPHCAQAVQIINELKKKYGEKKLRVAYKNFPLPKHDDARAASLALMCVEEQKPKSFWKFHNHLFENQRWLGNDKLKKYAKEFGVDSQKFDECLDGQKYKDYINSDIAEGTALGIRSTPTFFVNGKIVMGAQSLEVFSEIIDEELSR